MFIPIPAEIPYNVLPLMEAIDLKDETNRLQVGKQVFYKFRVKNDITVDDAKSFISMIQTVTYTLIDTVGISLVGKMVIVRV